jgi:hypothetical protein
LVNVLLGDGDVRALDGNALELGDLDIRLHLDLEGVGQRAALGELDRIRVVELRLPDHLKVVLLDGLLIAFGDERSSNLLLDVIAEALLDELLRRVSGPEPGDGRLLAQFLELLFQLGGDAVGGDLDGDPLGGGAGILNLDRVGEFVRGASPVAVSVAVAPVSCSDMGSSGVP